MSRVCFEWYDNFYLQLDALLVPLLPFKLVYWGIWCRYSRWGSIVEWRKRCSRRKTPVVVGGNRTRVLVYGVSIAASALNHYATYTLPIREQWYRDLIVENPVFFTYQNRWTRVINLVYLVKTAGYSLIILLPASYVDFCHISFTDDFYWFLEAQFGSKERWLLFVRVVCRLWILLNYFFITAILINMSITKIYVF